MREQLRVGFAGCGGIVQQVHLPLLHAHLDEFPRDADLLLHHGFLNARSGNADWQRQQFD